MSATAGLNPLQKREISCPHRESNHNSTAAQPVSSNESNITKIQINCRGKWERNLHLQRIRDHRQNAAACSEELFQSIFALQYAPFLEHARNSSSTQDNVQFC